MRSAPFSMTRNKETPSGQFVRKVGKSALELGQKKSIMSRLGVLHGRLCLAVQGTHGRLCRTLRGTT